MIIPALPGDANGLGLFQREYQTPARIWRDTYDADFDGEGYVGSCICPHCGDVSNHYTGAQYAGEPEFDCGACGHTSEIESSTTRAD